MFLSQLTRNTIYKLVLSLSTVVLVILAYCLSLSYDVLQFMKSFSINDTDLIRSFIMFVCLLLVFPTFRFITSTTSILFILYYTNYLVKNKCLHLWDCRTPYDLFNQLYDYLLY